MPNQLPIILIVAILAITVAGFLYYQRRRSQQFRGQFGPEYDRAVNEYGGRGKAESELARRVKRSNYFPTHELSQEERDRFADKWKLAQSRFVDEPGDAIAQAHGLVNEAMKARGYPVSEEFERNAEDLSADRPVVVQHYREACTIASRRGQGQVSAEDLRKAMTHYRALFEELLGSRVNESQEAIR